VRETFETTDQLQKAITIQKTENYLLNYNKKKFCVVLHENTTQLEQLKAYFHAYYVMILFFNNKEERSPTAPLDDPRFLESIKQWKTEGQEQLPTGWLEKTLDFVHRNFDSFVVRLQRAGWNIQNILLHALDLRCSWQRPSSEGEGSKTSDLVG